MSYSTRWLCFSLVALASMVASSRALAQDPTSSETLAPPSQGYYAAGSFGVTAFVGVGAALEVSGYFGAEELLPSLDLRGELGLVVKNSVALKVAGDALYSVARADRFTVSLGGGPRLVVGRAFDVGVGALAHFDVAGDESLSLFIEPALDLYFLGATQFAPSLSVGVRYPF